MNKLIGISFLKNYGFKTIDLIKYAEIIREDFVIKRGLSLRLSSIKKNNIDVNLPSIHNCQDKEVIKSFYHKYSKTYEILIHETVKPTIIGSISKYTINKGCKIVIEVFKNFEERKKGIIQERAIFDFVSERYLNFRGCTNKEFIFLGSMVKQIPFENFDLEFVKQYDNIIFTDFYTNEI